MLNLYVMTYEAKRAIILAAGSGSRMVPVTEDRPKPLIEVKGTRIIDTLLDAFLDAGIDDITIVRGYKKESFDKLLEKYPFLKFRDNDMYENTNSISSAKAALDLIEGGCYICEADLLINNSEVLRKYHASSDYLCSFARQTDGWCLSEKNGIAVNYRKGGEECFNCYGISFWTPEDCDQLRNDIEEVWDEEGGRNVTWESVPLVLRKENYEIKLHECQKGDVTRIDSLKELVALDPEYKHYEKIRVWLNQ